MSRHIGVRPGATGGSPNSDDILKVIADYHEPGLDNEQQLKSLLAAIITADTVANLQAALTALNITLSDTASNLANTYSLAENDLKYFRSEFLKAYMAAFYPANPVLSSARGGAWVNTAASWFKDSPVWGGSYQHRNIAGFLINNGLAKEDNDTASSACLTRSQVENAALIEQPATTQNAMGADVFDKIMIARDRLEQFKGDSKKARSQRTLAIQTIQQLCSDKIICTDDIHNTALNAFITHARDSLGVNPNAVFDTNIQQLTDIANTITDQVKKAQFNAALVSITTVEGARLLATALEEAVRKRNETPAIQAFVQWYDRGDIVHDEKLIQFLAYDFNGKSKQDIAAEIQKFMQKNAVSLPNFTTYLDTIDKPELAIQLQQALAVTVQKKEKEAVDWMIQQYSHGAFNDAGVSDFVQLTIPIDQPNNSYNVACIDLMCSNNFTIQADFNKHKVQFTTHKAASNFQAAMKAVVADKKQNTTAVIREIVALCHKACLSLGELVQFAKTADVNQLNHNAATFINRLPASFDPNKKVLFLGDGHQQARLDLQAALQEALPGFLKPDAPIARPASMGTNTLAGNLIETVLRWYESARVNAEGLQYFLKLDPKVIQDKNNSELLGILNAIRSTSVFSRPNELKDGGGVGPDDLKLAVTQLQKELKKRVTQTEFTDNQSKEVGRYFNDSQRQFITAELLYRMSEGQLDLDKLKKFMALSWDPEKSKADVAIIDEAIKLLNSMGEKVAVDDQFFNASFGKSDSYFVSLKNLSKDRVLILKALQELQTSLQAQWKATKTKSNTLTPTELAKYLIANIGKNLTDLLTSSDAQGLAVNGQLFKKQAEQFKIDTAGSQLDSDLRKLLDILERGVLPRPDSEDDKVLRDFFKFAESIRASLANSSALKKVFDRFDSIFKEQKIESEKPKKAGESDTAIFESVQFDDTSKDKVIVVTKGHGDVKDRTATITRHNKNKPDESLDVVGSVQSVVNAIVALYKAENIQNEFAIDVESLHLSNSAGNPLSAAKLKTVAELLDKKFEAEFENKYRKGSATVSLDPAVRSQWHRHGMGMFDRTLLVPDENAANSHHPPRP